MGIDGILLGAYSSEQLKRDIARHETFLSHFEIINRSYRLLRENASLAMILPTKEGEAFIEKAKNSGLYLESSMLIKGSTDSTFRRILLQFQNSPVIRSESTITMRKSDGNFSDDYLKLTDNFYLRKL